MNRKTKIVHKNPFYKVSHEKYKLPNGKIGDYYGIRGLRTVFVIPFLNKDKLILTKQYRYLVDSWSIEFPAGRVDVKGETSKKTALRELEEETGYKAQKIKKIGEFYPCKGLSDEICYIFVATDLIKTKQNLDETEDIKVVIKKISELEKLIKSGKILDGMTLASWQIFKSKL